jgi:hypothetical protein
LGFNRNGAKREKGREGERKGFGILKWVQTLEFKFAFEF